MGNYTQALVLSGLTVRMAHALQLNLEYSAGSSEPGESSEAASAWTYAEARRRLMWACYVLDTWTGSGVDQLTLLHEVDIKIQLPCSEKNYIQQIPCVTERLDSSHVFSHQGSPASLSGEPINPGGMMSHYVRLIAIWKRVARYVDYSGLSSLCGDRFQIGKLMMSGSRYVKHLDTAQPPWLPNSEFSHLQSDLLSWRSNLPPPLQFTAENISLRLESAQLGALALLHCTYHNATYDLYRISMPELFKLRNAIVFPPQQTHFLQEMRTQSLRSAQAMATVLADTAKFGVRFLTDSSLPGYAYNANRVMLYSVACLLDRDRPDAQRVVEETIGYVASNNRMLQLMAVMNPLAEPLVS